MPVRSALRPRWCVRLAGERSERGSSTTRQRHAADRRVEHLDRMRGSQVVAALAEQHLDLQGTAGVSADQQLGLGGEYAVDLALADLSRALGLEQIVDTGAAAAGIAVELDQVEAGDPSE